MKWKLFLMGRVHLNSIILHGICGGEECLGIYLDIWTPSRKQKCGIGREHLMNFCPISRHKSPCWLTARHHSHYSSVSQFQARSSQHEARSTQCCPLISRKGLCLRLTLNWCTNWSPAKSTHSMTAVNEWGSESSATRNCLISSGLKSSSQNIIQQAAGSSQLASETADKTKSAINIPKTDFNDSNKEYDDDSAHPIHQHRWDGMSELPSHPHDHINAILITHWTSLAVVARCDNVLHMAAGWGRRPQL